MLKEVRIDSPYMSGYTAPAQLHNPLSGSAIDALTTLFRLNLPSMAAADEALIALAGPGGSDFPPLVALDISV